MQEIIKNVEAEFIAKDVTDFVVGDTVTVTVKIAEEGKERLQKFTGICIARKGSGLNANFTLRYVNNGYGVERVFPLSSPRLGEIKVIRRGKVRRSKLFYLRERVGKQAMKVKEAPKK